MRLIKHNFWYQKKKKVRKQIFFPSILEIKTDSEGVLGTSPLSPKSFQGARSQVRTEGRR